MIIFIFSIKAFFPKIIQFFPYFAPNIDNQYEDKYTNVPFPYNSNNNYKTNDTLNKITIPTKMSNFFLVRRCQNFRLKYSPREYIELFFAGVKRCQTFSLKITKNVELFPVSVMGRYYQFFLQDREKISFHNKPETNKIKLHSL